MANLTAEQVAREIATNIAIDLRAHPENWIKGNFSEGLSAHCLVGHIICRIPMQVCGSQEDSVYDVFGKAIGLGPEGCISDWNDEPERTVEEVIALCDKVAQL